jgi:hypothetical protein
VIGGLKVSLPAAVALTLNDVIPTLSVTDVGVSLMTVISVGASGLTAWRAQDDKRFTFYDIKSTLVKLLVQRDRLAMSNAQRKPDLSARNQSCEYHLSIFIN